MYLGTEIKCPHCESKLTIDVYETYSESGKPTEEGFHFYCDDDLINGNQCKYTYDEVILLRKELYKWVMDNWESIATIFS